MTDLQGYSLPRSPEGRASLVPRPPWHYVGDFLVIEYWADPDAVAAVLPPGLEPLPGRSGPRGGALRRLAVVHGLARGAARPGAQPVQGVLPRRERAPRRRARDDLPVHLGRPGLRARARLDPGLSEEARLGLDDAHATGSTTWRIPGVKPGATFRRNARRERPPARRRARSRSSASRRAGPTHNDPPLVNVRHFPRLAAGQHDDPAVHELVRARSRDRADLGDLGGLGDARALRRTERGARPRSPRCGWARAFGFTFAYTVDDLATVREL